MSDNPNKYPGVLYVGASFVLAWLLIGAVTYAGTATNSLHSSAQSWAFVVVLAVLAAYGLSTVTDLWRKP